MSPKPVTVTHCWLQRTLVPSNVSLAVAGRFMGSFTQKTRFSHFGLQPTASLYHHVRCLTGFSHYGLQPTASYITNFGASLVLATLASGPLLAASSWELLACSSCPPPGPPQSHGNLPFGRVNTPHDLSHSSSLRQGSNSRQSSGVGFPPSRRSLFSSPDPPPRAPRCTFDNIC